MRRIVPAVDRKPFEPIYGRELGELVGGMTPAELRDVGEWEL